MICPNARKNLATKGRSRPRRAHGIASDIHCIARARSRSKVLTTLTFAVPPPCLLRPFTPGEFAVDKVADVGPGCESGGGRPEDAPVLGVLHDDRLAEGIHLGDPTEPAHTRQCILEVICNFPFRRLLTQCQRAEAGARGLEITGVHCGNEAFSRRLPLHARRGREQNGKGNTYYQTDRSRSLAHRFVNIGGGVVGGADRAAVRGRLYASDIRISPAVRPLVRCQRLALDAKRGDNG